MSDLTARLARLRKRLASTDDPEERADLEAAIDALAKQLAPADTAAASRTHIQHIHEYTSIATAVAGDVHGDIYIVGERTQSSTALMAGYLRWLASQCSQLPLRGVREQKAASDVLAISLDQVYTQLATSKMVGREIFEGNSVKQFNAETYHKEHTGIFLLPGQQRGVFVAQGFKNTDVTIPGWKNVQALVTDLAESPDSVVLFPGPNLNDLKPDSLASIARQYNRIDFYGPRLVTEAIAASSRLVLLGEPGSGKSTALRFLALTLARAGLDATVNLPTQLEGWQALGDAGKLIPIFMPLLPLAQQLAAHPNRNGTAADVWAAIDEHLVGHGATADIVDAMRAELARGHMLLLLDGLDEVAGGDSRRQVVQAVQAFATEQPQCRLVVTCRVRAYEGKQNRDWQLAGWPSATLADWIPGQVHAFIQAWYTAAAAASSMPAAKRDERITLLQRAIREREDLQRLSIRPLLLTIMALVHLNDGRLPEDRVTLYSRCLDILLGQWEIAKDDTHYGPLMRYIGLPDADVKTLRPLLARVAYAAQQAAGPGEVGRLRRAELREMVADALEQLKHPNPYDGAKRFLEYTDVRAGLLQASDAGDAYAFPHQTFQEYLAGLELISGVDFVERIMAVRTDDRWRVPIFLGIGHTVSEGVLSAPYQQLSRLLHAGKRDEAQRQRDFVFAAELAEDVGWDRLERGGEEFSALRANLARELGRAVEDATLPAAERVHAGNLLGRLGDLREGVCSLPPKMLRFEGGSFMHGLTADEYHQIPKDEQQFFYKAQNKVPVHIAPFELARYPVTNTQFAKFIAARGYDPKQKWWDAAGKDWLRNERRQQPAYWQDGRFGIGRPSSPVVGVSWYEAIAFCRWLTQQLQDGYIYMLPSEPEWEYAASGTERRTYPWGQDEPNAERANYNGTYGSTTAVGCFVSGATPEGLQDMAGNVYEWTRSEYRRYPYDPNDGRESFDNPTEKRFALRGGGWLNDSIFLRASFRGRDKSENQDYYIGFRVERHHKM